MSRRVGSRARLKASRRRKKPSARVSKGGKSTAPRRAE